MHKCEEWSIHKLYTQLDYQASHTFPHTPYLVMIYEQYSNKKNELQTT
jgi:hypothetical protein